MWSGPHIRTRASSSMILISLVRLLKVKNAFKLSGSSWWVSKTRDGKSRMLSSAARLNSVLKYFRKKIILLIYL